jgi:hypothetical protein
VFNIDCGQTTESFLDVVSNQNRIFFLAARNSGADVKIG